MTYDNNLFMEHLRKMIQIPTVSNADPEKMDIEAFLKLHAYLEEAYPLVHQKMTREVIGRAGLYILGKEMEKAASFR